MANSLQDKKILIIVESPKKVPTITTILKKAGYKNARVKASVGHIQKIADNPKSWKNTGIWPDDHFRPDLVIADDKQSLVLELSQAAAVADLVYIATDPDREGEVIAASLVHFLSLDLNKTKRMLMHAIVQKEVINGLENPVSFDDWMAKSGLTRAIIDKLNGYSISPFLRMYLGAKSGGRTQSAGLRILVDRELERLEFIPTKYYDIYLNFSKGKTKFKAKYIGTAVNVIDHLNDIETVNAVKALCTGDYKIKDIVRAERKENPKPPFCTSTFQQEASKRLSLSVKAAMDCAQKLSEGIDVNGQHIAVITYHRTDSTSMSPEFIPDLKKYVEDTYGAGSFNTPKAGKKDANAQEGHEALRVTNPNLTPDELKKYINNDLLIKVYRLIWQRTVASVLPPAIYSETKYIINNSDQLFVLNSRELLNPGYKQAYNYSSDDDDDTVDVKDTFKIGEVLKKCSLEDVEKETKPKPRFSEGTLISEIQSKGFGRPSTYATIVNTNIDRGYCVVENKELVPTKLGMRVIECMKRVFPKIVDYEYTANMEEKLDLIAQGKLDPEVVIKENYDYLVDALNKNTEGINGANSDQKCPLCGSDMVLRRNKWGKLFYGCGDFPRCRGIVNIK